MEGVVAAREASEESASGEIDPRVTYDGIVAARCCDQVRGYAGRVTFYGWFPDHLKG